MSIPPSVGDVFGAAGACPEIRHGEKVWKVGHPTQAAKDRLEKLVVADAWANIKAAAIGIPEVDDEAVRLFHEAVRNREYRTGGKMWSAAFGRLDGNIKFYLSLIQEHHPEATEADVLELMSEKPDEFLTAMELVTPRFFFVAAEAMGLPPDKGRKWATERAAEFLDALKKARPQTMPTS
jgi:hypothetical protein